MSVLKGKILIMLLVSTTGLFGAQTDSLVIDLKIKSKISLIEFKVNGKKALFILDTGSSISLVDKDQAKSYGFKSFPTKGSGNIQGLGGNNTFSITSKIKLQYNNTFQCNHKFYSCDISNIITILQKKKIKILGILGADFFLKHKAVINYDKKSLVIY